MSKKKKLNILYYIFLLSCIGIGTTLITLSLLDNVVSYNLYINILRFPETILLKVLVTLHYAFEIILLSYILFLTGLIKRPLTIDIKLFIHRKQIYPLFKNSRIKKTITYFLFFAFSIPLTLLFRTLLILDIWFPELMSTFSWIIWISFISQFVFGGLFVLDIEILYLLTYIKRRKERNTDIIKRSVIKEHLGKYKSNFPHLYGLLTKWLDGELKRKFEDLYQRLPNRAILSEEEVFEILDDTSPNAEKLKKEYQENKKRTYLGKEDYRIFWFILAVFIIFAGAAIFYYFVSLF